jgi:Rv2632c-like
VPFDPPGRAFRLCALAPPWGSVSDIDVAKGVTMGRTATWHIEVFLFEEGERTRAEAVLRTSAGTELRHEGVARRNPRDTEVPEIGEELATARALSGLTHDLLEATVSDIEENVHAAVHLKA